jgi:flagellar basal body P-ring protein FlgI
MLLSNFGCEKPAATTELVPQIELGTTIDSLVEVFSYQSTPVEGYAIVGALDGTGSSECPQPIRDYLEKFILKQLPEQQTNIDKIISSPNTAVVLVRGLMPFNEGKASRFDIKVEALTGTQTTSLEGGWLYATELKPVGTFAVTMKVFAKAGGPVYIDKIDSKESDQRIGYVLGGGTVLEENKIVLALRTPDYKTSNAIRNRINSRFGFNTARAASNSQIELGIPEEYAGRRKKFIELVRSIYMQQSPALTKERILASVRKLAVTADKHDSEIALEAIGRQSINELTALLNHSSEEVRLRAARCMLNLGDDRGLERLGDIAFDDTSTYRIEAIEAISSSARRNDAANILRRLLKDDNFDIRLAAYENLRKFDDIFITQDLIADSFLLEQIIQTPHKTVYATRSGQCRIALFGAPIYCRRNSFIQSADGQIIINAAPDQNYVSIIRKHPTRAESVIKLQSSFELGDIIRTLAESPVKKPNSRQLGLGVTYAEIISILKQMSQAGAIEADFQAGGLPKI